MGEDLALPDRMSVRTPMQWSSEPNGGFSKAPAGMVAPAVIEGGRYGFPRVNVADQEFRHGSLFSKVAQLVHRRPELGELPPHRCEALALRQRSVFAVAHHRGSDAVLMLANLSTDEVEVDLPYDVRTDLLADSEYEPASKNSVRLAGHGYRWLHCHAAAA